MISMDNLFCIERLILVVLCFVCLSCKKSELILVQGQTHNYQIVISEDANLDEQKAAFTLQKYIEAMSGKKLPIISETDLASEKSIWVGATLKTKGLDLEPSEIIYKVIGEGLIVAGGNSKSTLNAVYTFLENLLILLGPKMQSQNFLIELVNQFLSNY